MQCMCIAVAVYSFIVVVGGGRGGGKGKGVVVYYVNNHVIIQSTYSSSSGGAPCAVVCRAFSACSTQYTPLSRLARLASLLIGAPQLAAAAGLAIYLYIDNRVARAGCKTYYDEYIILYLLLFLTFLFING